MCKTIFIIAGEKYIDKYNIACYIDNKYSNDFKIIKCEILMIKNILE